MLNIKINMEDSAIETLKQVSLPLKNELLLSLHGQSSKKPLDAERLEGSEET